MELCRLSPKGVLADSNGSYDFSADEELTDALEGVMPDVKAGNEAELNRLMGERAGPVTAHTARNIAWLAKKNKLTELRSVIVPSRTDVFALVRETAALLAQYAPRTPYKLISYRAVGVRQPYRESLEPPTAKLMRELAELARTSGAENVTVI